MKMLSFLTISGGARFELKIAWLKQFKQVAQESCDSLVLLGYNFVQWWKVVFFFS